MLSVSGRIRKEDVFISDRTAAPVSGSPLKTEERAPLLPARVARGTALGSGWGVGSVYLLLLPWLHSPLIQQWLHVVILMVVPHGAGNHPGLGPVPESSQGGIGPLPCPLGMDFKKLEQSLSPSLSPQAYPMETARTAFLVNLFIHSWLAGTRS